METFQELLQLHLLSIQKTFFAIDNYFELNQKDEIKTQMFKIEQLVNDLIHKLQKVCQSLFKAFPFCSLTS